MCVPKVRPSRITGGSMAARHCTSAIAVEASSAAANASCAISKNASPIEIALDRLAGKVLRASSRARSAVAPRRCNTSAYARARSMTRSFSGSTATVRSCSPSGVETAILPSFIRRLLRVHFFYVVIGRWEQAACFDQVSLLWAHIRVGARLLGDEIIHLIGGTPLIVGVLASVIDAGRCLSNVGQG